MPNEKLDDIARILNTVHDLCQAADVSFVFAIESEPSDVRFWYGFKKGRQVSGALFRAAREFDSDLEATKVAGDGVAQA